MASASSDSLSPGRDAWLNRIIAENAPMLMRYAQSLTDDPERARDAVQDTFVRLCREEREHLEGRERPWLFRVCRSRVIDHARKDRRLVSGGGADGTWDHLPDNVALPSERVEASERAGRLLEMVEDLPERQREVVRLKFQAGLSYRAIAEATGLSVTNVGFILHQSLKKLRARMEGLDQAETSD